MLTWTTFHEGQHKTDIPTDSSHDQMRKSEHILTNITPQLEEKGATGIVTISRNTETMIEDTKEWSNRIHANL